MSEPIPADKLALSNSIGTIAVCWRLRLGR
jgi:hypothetical protein